MANTKKTEDNTFEKAKDLYENVIKHQLTDDQLGMYLVIDVETGDYEIGPDGFNTVRALQKRQPSGRLFRMLHGSYTVGSIGYAPPTPGSWSLVE